MAIGSKKPPVFIVGWPRSGTTLLAKMLSAHPNMVCGAETHLFSKIPLVDLENALESSVDELVRLLVGLKLTGQSVIELYGVSESELRSYLACPSSGDFVAQMVYR